jgi:uncharacterized protein YndB with AHSA1/START domain
MALRARDPDRVRGGLPRRLPGDRPDERVVNTEPCEGVPDGEAVVTTTFADRDGGTLLTSLVQHSCREHRDAHIASGMESGLQTALDLLDEVAISLA